MDVLFSLQKLFRETLDDDAITIVAETRREDIDGWDSVAQVKLMLAIEGEFGFQFGDDEIASIRTVGDFVRSIELRRGKAA